MKKIFSLLLCVFFAITALADGPFRNHRYDSFKTLSPPEGSIIFIGNSITDMHCWPEVFKTSEGKYLPIVNRGNSGTYSTEQSDNIESYIINNPKKVFMMIGTNDIATSGGLNFSGEQVLQYIKSIVERIHMRSPETKIYLYSILKNKTNNRVETTWLHANELIKEYVNSKNATNLKYVDLYDKLTGIADGGVWSYDKLHLTAAAYKVWCETICEHLAEGEDYTVTTVYPEDTSTKQYNAGLNNSHGMRATYFSMLPISEEDILVFGDEFIKNGEWQELLGNSNVKNRGTGWGYGGDIATTSKMVDATYADTGVEKKNAKAIFIYTGTGDCNGQTAIETVKSNYKALVDKVAEKSPSSKIYLMALCPTNNADNTSRVAALNEYLRTLAKDNIRYVDTYTPLLNGNVAEAKYFYPQNYLGGAGYVKFANLMKEALVKDFPNDTYNVITEEEGEKRHAQATLRNSVSQVVAKGMIAERGTGIGMYDPEKMKEFDAELNNVKTFFEKSEITESEANEFRDRLNEIIGEAMSKPQTSTNDNEVWYKIYTPNRNNRYLTSQGVGVQLIGESENNYARSQWKFVARSDGKLDIVNRNDGSYLSPVAEYDKPLSTSALSPDAGWELSYGNVAGTFIIYSGTTQLNQTQEALGWKIYNWSTDKDGRDRNDIGCLYSITLVTEEPEEEVIVESAITKPGDIVAGWYQIKTVNNSTADTQEAIKAGKDYMHTVEREFRQNASNYYPLKYAALDEDNPVTSYIYITPGGQNFNLKALNGHHLNSNATASRNATNAISITGSEGRLQVGKWAAYKSDGAEQPYVGLYSSSSNECNIFRVKSEELNGYDIYTVNITGETTADEIGNDILVSCSNNSNLGIESVYDGGYFFFPKGTAVAASDFSVPMNNGNSAKIAINGKEIKVTYGEAEYSSIRYSTEGNEVWYYIVSASTEAYCAGMAIKTNGDGAFTYGNVTLDPDMIWCFIKNADGKVAIKNYGGKYMSKIQDKNNPDAGLVREPHYNYTITTWNGTAALPNAYTIKSDASNDPIHAQDDNDVIVTWPAKNNGASLWSLRELTESELNTELKISNLTVEQSAMGVGIGGKEHALLRISFVVTGLKGYKALGAFSGSVNSDNVERVRIYKISDMFEYRTGREGCELVGEDTPDSDGNFSIVFDTPQQIVSNSSAYYWLVADIKATAKEGDIIDAEIKSYTLNGTEQNVKNGNPANSATVFLTASTVEYLNTYGSRYYRIPAITTAKNGWLVVATDKRWNSEGDLPNNIDVVARVSKDNGLTWSEPIVIAGTPELGGDYGHGDPAIVTDMVTGDIHVLVCSKKGFYSGTPTDPQLIKVITSHDNGETWDAPVDITNQLYGAGCSDSERSSIHALFPSSGSFMQTRDGTLMCVAPTRPTSSQTHSTFQARIISSKDHGKTWTLSNNYALTDADESKIVELDNGDLLVASRHGGSRYYAISSDGGASWGPRGNWNELVEPFCNGDMIRLTSLSAGDDKNRLLHSIPNNAGSRQNVTVFLSTDEGKTWPVKKSVCPKGSAYSALTVLTDGTIGCYYEEAALEGGYQMRFVRFSLEWLTDGKDSIVSDNFETGIEEVSNSKAYLSVIYDLYGRRIENITKSGIYIINGKKVIVK